MAPTNACASSKPSSRHHPECVGFPTPHPSLRLSFTGAQYGKSFNLQAENYTTHDVASVFCRYLTLMPVRGLTLMNAHAQCTYYAFFFY